MLGREAEAVWKMLMDFNFIFNVVESSVLRISLKNFKTVPTL
jgi:hypothetical protein